MKNIQAQGCTSNASTRYYRGLLTVCPNIDLEHLSIFACDAKGEPIGEEACVLGSFDQQAVKFILAVPKTSKAVQIKAFYDNGSGGGDDSGNGVSVGGSSNSGHGDKIQLDEINLRDFPSEPLDAYLNPNYANWYAAHAATDSELQLQREQSFAIKPIFSIIVPLFKTPLRYLRDLVKSVLSQTYPNFELILVNASPQSNRLSRAVAKYCTADQRIQEVKLQGNLGITKNTNAGITQASGDFLCFLDHDDILTADALYCYAQAINDDPDTDLLYCDEDMLSRRGKLFGPILKPDFSMDMLCGKNFVIHFLTARKAIVDKLEPPGSEFDAAQDYHMTFRVAEQARSIRHISRILYHWRVSRTSIAVKPSAKPYAEEAGRLAIERHLQRCSIAAQVRCSLGHPNVYEVVYEPAPDVEVSKVQLTDNLSKLNKTALETDGSVLLFVNADSIIDNEQTLPQLVGVCLRPDVGIVGATTHFANGVVRSNGLSLGFKDSQNFYITHLNRYLPKGNLGYINQTLLDHDVRAVDAVGLTIKTSLFKELGGFDEKYTTAATATIDLCLRAQTLGHKVIQLSSANITDSSPLAYDDESGAGWSDTLKQDQELLISKHQTTLLNQDSNYNPHLNVSNGFYQLA